MFYEESEIFQFLTMFIVKMGHILPKRKNATTDSFEYSIVSDKLPENWKKVQKMLGANRLIFAMDPKLDLDAETLVLHWVPKFLCFLV